MVGLVIMGLHNIVSSKLSKFIVLIGMVIVMVTDLVLKFLSPTWYCDRRNRQVYLNIAYLCVSLSAFMYGMFLLYQDNTLGMSNASYTNGGNQNFGLNSGTYNF